MGEVCSISSENLCEALLDTRIPLADFSLKPPNLTERHEAHEASDDRGCHVVFLAEREADHSTREECCEWDIVVSDEAFRGGRVLFLQQESVRLAKDASSLTE